MITVIWRVLPRNQTSLAGHAPYNKDWIVSLFEEKSKTFSTNCVFNRNEKREIIEAEKLKIFSINCETIAMGSMSTNGITHCESQDNKEMGDFSYIVKRTIGTVTVILLTTSLLLDFFQEHRSS